MPLSFNECCYLCDMEYNKDLSDRDGPKNSLDSCQHYLCVDCWFERYNNNQWTCPSCNINVKEWLDDNYECDEDEYDEDEKYNE